MEVRDADEDDAARVATLIGAPASVVRELVHDRTTRIATAESDSDSDSGADTNNGPAGVVSFDARHDTVYVTRLAGTDEAVSRLLDEPIRFARREGMTVEALIEAGRTDLQGIVADAGLERAGSGPRFDGQETVVFRLDP